jgi:DNA-binding transcriptional MerR regulator
VSAAAERGPARARRVEPGSMSIGSVLALLRPDFADISISKIRFLEDQGLVEPQRTASGYRKFSHADVDRLRYVLGVQRDHYLPLRVIREHLDAMDRGLEPPVGPAPGSPRLVSSNGRTGPASSTAAPTHDRDRRLSRTQLLEAAGIDEDLLAALEAYGMVAARPGGGFDSDALVITRTAGELAAFGIEPRHLRAFRSAADREAGLVEQVVNPLRAHRGTEAAARAEEATREVSGLCVRLHAALVKTALERGGT